jgi:hypothetical protein
MRKDCPNCNQSMDGRFLQWRKFAKMDHFRACPICGKPIEFHMYPEEIIVRVASGALVIYGFWWAKEHGRWIPMLLAVAAIIATAFVLVNWRLRERQRFRRA